MRRAAFLVVTVSAGAFGCAAAQEAPRPLAYDLASARVADVGEPGPSPVRPGPAVGVPAYASLSEPALRPYLSADLGRLPRDADASRLFGDDDLSYQVTAGARVPRGRGTLGAEVAYLGARDLEGAQEGDIAVRFKGPKVQVTYAFSF